MNRMSRVVLASTLAVLTFGVAEPTDPVATELSEELAPSTGLSSADVHAVIRDLTTPATLDCAAPSVALPELNGSMGSLGSTNDASSSLPSPPMDDEGPPCGRTHCFPCLNGAAYCCNDCGCFYAWCT